jgi:hypothetical protein
MSSDSDSIQVPVDVFVNIQTALSDLQRRVKIDARNNTTQNAVRDALIESQGETNRRLEILIENLNEQLRSPRPRIDGQLLANAENKTRNLQTNVNDALTDPGITDDERQLLNDLNKIAVQILVFLGRVAITVKSLGWIVPVLVVPIVALAWPNTAAWLLGGLGAMLGGGVIGTAGGVMLPIVLGGVIVYSTMTK